VVRPTANTLKAAELLGAEPLLVFFSTGKDSIVTADLLFKHYPGEKKLVFLYFVQGLSIKQKIIEYYEKRWNTKIDQHPNFIHLNMKQDKKKYKLSDIERGLRAKYNISWIAQGVRRDESLARRGMLASCEYGIDERQRKIYPVADFSAKQIMAYIKFNNLRLPPEYNHGWKHDFSTPDVEGLVYLKNNFPEDYRKVIAEFPHLEAMVYAQENF
jgi:3'-phosphoadenosine 5'-phosphosulfate sulfotransferase (PAPS reductase)/FAD synthetase